MKPKKTENNKDRVSKDFLHLMMLQLIVEVSRSKDPTTVLAAMRVIDREFSKEIINLPF